MNSLKEYLINYKKNLQKLLNKDVEKKDLDKYKITTTPPTTIDTIGYTGNEPDREKIVHYMLLLETEFDLLYEYRYGNNNNNTNLVYQNGDIQINNSNNLHNILQNIAVYVEELEKTIEKTTFDFIGQTGLTGITGRNNYGNQGLEERRKDISVMIANASTGANGVTGHTGAKSIEQYIEKISGIDISKTSIDDDIIQSLLVTTYTTLEPSSKIIATGTSHISISVQ